MFKRFFHKQNVYRRWVIFGCITLLIPIFCAILNYVFNKSFVEKKVYETNQHLLDSLQYNIDSRLQILLATTNSILLDNDFSGYRLNTNEEPQFGERVRKCYNTLKTTKNANEAINILVYLPQKSFLLTSKVANHIDGIYQSLTSQNKLSLSKEEYLSQLQEDGTIGFLISDALSYEDYGCPSLVYASSLLQSRPALSDKVYVSTPASFIEELLINKGDAESTENSLFIMDESDSILACFGRSLSLASIPIDKQPLNQPFRLLLDQKPYIALLTESEVSKWHYLICTPENSYMQEIRQYSYSNALVILIGATLGVLAVLRLQKKNYQPLQNIMDSLPSSYKSIPSDEFAKVKKAIAELYQENQSMSRSLETNRSFAKSLSLLYAITGQSSYQEFDSIDTFYSGRCQHPLHALITLVSETGSPDIYENVSRDMISFLVTNIAQDLFGSEYEIISTIDYETIVLLLFMSPEQKESYLAVAPEQMEALNDLFEKRLNLSFSITLGLPIDSADSLESAYAQMCEIMEQRYYLSSFGVHWSSDFTTSCLTNGRMDYYCKSLRDAIKQDDRSHLLRCSEELFMEIQQNAPSYTQICCYLTAIVNNLLFPVYESLRQDDERKIAVETAADRVRKAEAMTLLKSEFHDFLLALCQDNTELSKDSSTLSDTIKEYVANHYQDCGINISTISDEIGITPRYMAKLFKDQAGINLLNYINDIRIAHAKTLLCTTDMTVDEISLQTGFSNSRTFRRNFLKAVGVTPSQYKQSVNP